MGKASHIFSTKITGIFQIQVFETLTYDFARAQGSVVYITVSLMKLPVKGRLSLLVPIQSNVLILLAEKSGSDIGNNAFENVF